MKFNDTNAALDINIDLKMFHKGKVRNVYDVEGGLILCATDRLSAFDCVFPNGIPSKGKILTQISNKWFEIFKDIPNHIIATDIDGFPEEAKKYKTELEERSVYVKKCKRIDIECVVRGYIIGSAWKEYVKDQTVCGIELPAGLKMAEKFPEPIFTPSTKSDTGHDENISFEQMKDLIGAELSEKLKDRSIEIYTKAADKIRDKGVIIADTKFEFGLIDDEIILIDEILTPDSSRFWPASDYKVGESPVSYDKQFIRDYLETTDWDKTPPAPALPEDIINKSREKYLEIYNIIADLK